MVLFINSIIVNLMVLERKIEKDEEHINYRCEP